jgi:hypothetical protein
MGITSVLQNFKLSRFTWFWVPTIGYCVLIFVLSSVSKGVSVPWSFGFDKVLHVIEYGILGFLLARSLANYKSRISSAPLIMWVVALTALYGLSDEVHQFFVPGRNASVWDVVADSLGAVLGGFFYVRFFHVGQIVGNG